MKSCIQHSATKTQKLNITNVFIKNLNISFEKLESRFREEELETSIIQVNTTSASNENEPNGRIKESHANHELHVDRCVLFGRCDSAYVPNWYCQCDEVCERYKD